MQPVRAILFDFGHTLVDFRRTQEALHDAYQRIKERVEAAAYMEVPELLDLVERVAGGVDRLVAESYEQRRMEEVDQAQLFRQAFAGIGFDLPDDLIEHIVALDHSAYSNSITVEPKVMETMEHLRREGYRMGLGEPLEATVFSSEVGVRKPDARIFQEALGRIGVEPLDTVFVGDRLYDDVSGAQAVGMRAVLTRQFRQEDDPEYSPDATIDHLSELPAILRSWNGTS